MEYTLFDVDISHEYRITFYDGAHNKRTLVVFAVNLSDAIEQARNKALSNGYMPPYQFASAQRYDD